MLFEDRVDAGRKLAEKLILYKDQKSIVLALPRGGVPIGYEIAKILNVPLDVLVVRKLGAPFNPEFGIGAIAPGVKILDQTTIEHLGISEGEIKQIEKSERKELNRRLKEYRGFDFLPDINGKTVILVDDGLATGVTARAAIKSVLLEIPRKLIVAIPVCSIDAIEGIRSIVRPLKDEVICLTTPFDFSAVGHWYKSFDEVSDLEVVNLLKRSQKDLDKFKQKRSVDYPKPQSILHKVRRNYDL